MDERKLINVKLDDGSIVPLVNNDELELVETEEGFKIQLKSKPDLSDERFGIK